MVINVKNVHLIAIVALNRMEFKNALLVKKGYYLLMEHVKKVAR